jgi:hypothetical protein
MGDMDIGAVGFKNDKLVRRVHVKERVNDIVNRLNKTKSEGTIQDFILEVENVEKEDRQRKRREEKERVRGRLLVSFADSAKNANFSSPPMALLVAKAKGRG